MGMVLFFLKVLTSDVSEKVKIFEIIESINLRGNVDKKFPLL